MDKRKIKTEIEKAVEKAVKGLRLELQLKDQEIHRLKLRIKELEGQLAKNSCNNKPPSSDGLKKTNPKSLRKSSGLKTGGQVGHPGNTLEQVVNPDFIETYKVCLCEKCGHSLEDIKLASHKQRQEFELPSIKIKVTEHRSEIKICPACGFVNKARLPKNITQPVQYGAQIKSMATYFSYDQCRKKHHPSHNLWRRLSEHREETLAFMNNFSVPFTNNQGERDIRIILKSDTS